MSVRRRKPRPRRAPVVLDDLSIDRREQTTEDQSWRRRLLERGFRSAIGVALTAGGVRYGTLTAYANRPSAFDDRTRRACRHLASIAGAVIGAIETKRALLADRITELEVVIRDDAEALSSIARGIDRPLDVRAIVPRSSGGSTVFCTVGGGDADAIQETIGSLSAVDAISIVDRDTGGTVLEIGLREPTVARAIAEHGGILRSVTPVDGRCRLVIELGDPVDVRSFLDHLERGHPRHGTGRSPETRSIAPRPVRPFDDLSQHLSERQRRTLEAAYYGGFSSGRASTPARRWPSRSGSPSRRSVAISGCPTKTVRTAVRRTRGRLRRSAVPMYRRVSRDVPGRLQRCTGAYADVPGRLQRCTVAIAGRFAVAPKLTDSSPYEPPPPGIIPVFPLLRAVRVGNIVFPPVPMPVNTSTDEYRLSGDPDSFPYIAPTIISSAPNEAFDECVRGKT